MESCEFETFCSVLELVRDEPTAVIDDSSFDKIVDSLYEVCKADSKYLDSVFQSVSRMEETLKQLAVNVNSKAAAFGIRLLEICIVFQKVPYQHTASLLKQLLTVDNQLNVVCAVLGVVKAILNSYNGLCWLLEEKLYLLVINQFAISSYFVVRMTEDVIHCMILGCAEQLIDKNSSNHELCRKCLDELATYLDIDSQSTIVPFTTLIRILSHLITSGLSAEALQYLFDTYWPFDKWFAQFAIRKAEECHAVLNLFETCIKTHWITLLRPFLSDDSIVLGHASSLCGRGMIPVAMRLLMLTASLPSLNGVKPNNCYYQLLLYPLSVFLQGDDDRVSFPTDDHKVMVASVRQFVFDHTEQALLSALKCVKYVMKILGSDWWAQCLELCINLLEACANRSTEVQYKLSTSSQHKLITEVLVILSEDDNCNHLKMLSLLLTNQLASCLATIVQRRSFPLQIVCKSLYLIGRILTTLLQPAVDVAGGDISTSGCGLVSSIAESLQLCSMDINWEIRDSCIELIGSLSHDQISDGMIQFLSSSKLCEVLVTHGLVDVEPCVKASAILSLSSVVTNPPLAKVFMQQRSDNFSNHLNAAHTILEFTDVSSHETTVRLNAWRAFHIVCARNSELLGLLTDGNDSLHKLSTHLSQGIADDNWEIKAEVMEILLLIYQSLITRQSSIPDYVACCSSQDHNTHDSKCHVLNSLNFFPVLKEAITDYHIEVKKRAKELVGMFENTPHNCDCHQCKKCILEMSELCCSNSTVQEKSPQEMFLDVLQEILMAAKCEESELRETDCY